MLERLDRCVHTAKNDLLKVGFSWPVLHHFQDDGVFPNYRCCLPLSLFTTLSVHPIHLINSFRRHLKTHYFQAAFNTPYSGKPQRL